MSDMPTDLQSPTWELLRQRLQARLADVKAQIRAYPAPIPACDAQYNHLLEARSGLARALTRAHELAGAGAADRNALRRFAQACPYLEAADREALRGPSEAPPQA